MYWGMAGVQGGNLKARIIIGVNRYEDLQEEVGMGYLMG